MILEARVTERTARFSEIESEGVKRSYCYNFRLMVWYVLHKLRRMVFVNIVGA